MMLHWPSQGRTALPFLDHVGPVSDQRAVLSEPEDETIIGYCLHGSLVDQVPPRMINLDVFSFEHRPVVNGIVARRGGR